MDEIISFLDFEASSLSSRSYPIEVAWSNQDGSIESHLISPAGIDSWIDWDPEAEKVHGISRPELIEHGQSPQIVCDRISDQLSGKTVYTDAPSFDGRWLSTLFSACGRGTPPVKLAHIDDLLVRMICPDLAGRTQGLITIGVLKQESRNQSPRRHRAKWSVEYLMKFCE